jgi:hypothetical protein
MTDINSLPTVPIDVAPFRYDTLPPANEPRQKSVGADEIGATCDQLNSGRRALSNLCESVI